MPKANTMLNQDQYGENQVDRELEEGIESTLTYGELDFYSNAFAQFNIDSSL